MMPNETSTPGLSFQSPRMSLQDAVNALGSYMVGANYDGIKTMWEIDAQDMRTDCPVCGQEFAVQLLPQTNGSIKAECLSDAGCKKRDLERRFKEKRGLGLRRRRGSKPRAPKDLTVDTPIYEDSVTGDGWRLLWEHGPRLLLVWRLGQLGDVYVLDLDSGTWRADRNELGHLHERAARSYAVNMALRAQQGEVEMNKALGFQRWARRTQSSSGLENVIQWAGVAYKAMDEEGLGSKVGRVAQAHELDADRHYLGCANGVLDLTDGRLLGPDEAQNHLVTRSTGVEYDPKANHDFVRDLLGHLQDSEADYILDSAAYALRGNPGRRWHLLVGEKGGGKTTFLNAIRAAVGDADAYGYGFGLKPGLLLKDRNPSREGHTESLKHFPVGRIATAAELPDMSKRFDDDLLKMLTGGDPIPIREIYGRMGASRPSSTTIFQAVNPGQLARLSLIDDALADRTSILRWPTLPAETRRDSNRVTDVLAPAVAKAMLAELVRRAVELKQPPPMPENVKDYVDQKRRSDLGEVGAWFLVNIEITDSPKDVVTPEQIWDAAIDAVGPLDDKEKLHGMDRKETLGLLREAKPGLPAQRPKRIDGKVRNAYIGVRLLDSVESSCSICFKDMPDQSDLKDLDGRGPVCPDCRAPDDQGSPPGAAAGGESKQGRSDTPPLSAAVKQRLDALDARRPAPGPAGRLWWHELSDWQEWGALRGIQAAIRDNPAVLPPDMVDAYGADYTIDYMIDGLRRAMPAGDSLGMTAAEYADFVAALDWPVVIRSMRESHVNAVNRARDRIPALVGKWASRLLGALFAGSPPDVPAYTVDTFAMTAEGEPPELTDSILEVPVGMPDPATDLAGAVEYQRRAVMGWPKDDAIYLSAVKVLEGFERELTRQTAQGQMPLEGQLPQTNPQERMG